MTATATGDVAGMTAIARGEHRDDGHPGTFRDCGDVVCVTLRAAIITGEGDEIADALRADALRLEDIRLDEAEADVLPARAARR